jgi:hypothetical protein
MKFLFLALFALYLTHLSSADTQGSVQLYSDGDCSTTQGKPISRPYNSCIEANQAGSIAAISLPSCPSGLPFLFISDEEKCNRPSIQPAVESNIVGDCLSLLTGSGIGSAAFVCINQVAAVSNSQPAATPIIEPTVPSTSTSATYATTPEQSATQNTPGSVGMTFSDKIALGCGLGIGVPALIFGILTWYSAWDQWREHQRHPPLRLIHGEGLPPPPYELHLRQV